MRGWELCSADISKAFLQGVTYEELHKLTGEPLREVNFSLPPASVGLLQRVPGFEGFNPNTEVLHCDKPGTGSVDAPRCFSMKLSICTSQQCGMKPSSVDQELCMLHVKENGTVRLVCLMTKHVDDVKLTGESKWIHWVLQKVEHMFGELKISWLDFTNCGVRHVRDMKAGTCTLDQIEYTQKLRTITHEEVRTKSTETLCGPDLHKLYMSLLGAIAYVYLTRVDILVFIAALQRFAHSPKIIHVKRLNAVVRWVQRNPKRLTYRSFSTILSHLKVVSDAAFKKEEDKDKGFGLRGSIYLRAPGNTDKCFVLAATVHCLEFMCKALRNVTRSTFSSELHAACDSVDLGILLQLLLHEISSGPVTAMDARELRTSGGYDVPMIMHIDALSVFAAITATFVKAPAEKGLLNHIQFIRELLDTHVLFALLWIDTRDMLSDGLTKGSVDRAQLHACMDGYFKLLHEPKIWSSKILKKPQDLIEEATLHGPK